MLREKVNMNELKGRMLARAARLPECLLEKGKCCAFRILAPFIVPVWVFCLLVALGFLLTIVLWMIVLFCVVGASVLPVRWLLKLQRGAVDKVVQVLNLERLQRARPRRESNVASLL
jgi:hypothetical protein